MPPIVKGIVMSFRDQKCFTRVTHLGPPKFSNVMGKDAYKFLIDYQDKFITLDLLSHIGFLTLPIS